jgi:hypothetical protein
MTFRNIYVASKKGESPHKHYWIRVPILTIFSGEELAVGFQRIPNRRLLPDYFDIIAEPIAFSTIRVCSTYCQLPTDEVVNVIVEQNTKKAVFCFLRICQRRRTNMSQCSGLQSPLGPYLRRR